MSKKYSQLTLKERYTIEELIQAGRTQNYIAEKLGLNKSTISRELRRNKDDLGEYVAKTASSLAKARRIRTRFRKITKEAERVIEEQLIIGCTPEQISAHLRNGYGVFFSHELIYQYIGYKRAAGEELHLLLPHRGDKYKKRNLKTPKRNWKTAKKRRSIDDRPVAANEKREIGHWEGDTVEGKAHKGGLGTFVDRKSMFLVMGRVADKSSEAMKEMIVGSFRHYPAIVKSVTVDNGTEFALHDEVEAELKTRVYFAHPYSPWERGLNENTNGLIRRFYPKGTDFSEYSDADISRVQNLLNNRPRKTLGYKTPREVFYEGVRLGKSSQMVMNAISF
jgi:IS30 family transposase